VIVETFRLAGNRVGKDSEIVAETFGDDVEVATRVLELPAVLFVRASESAAHESELRLHRSDTAMERAEAAIRRSETTIHRTFELGDCHRRTPVADHSIVAAATTVPPRPAAKTGLNERQATTLWHILQSRRASRVAFCPVELGAPRTRNAADAGEAVDEVVVKTTAVPLGSESRRSTGRMGGA
jgi:hypothetical protein